MTVTTPTPNPTPSSSTHTPHRTYRKVKIHSFKTNLSRHIRELEAGLYDAVIVCKHRDEVGMFLPIKRLREPAEAPPALDKTLQKLAKYPAHKPPLPWE